MSDFNLRVVEGSPHRVFVAGDIDFATAHRVTELLCELSGDEINVDCEGVTFIDTAGFDALDWGYVVATARGHTFAVVGLRDFQPRVHGASACAATGTRAVPTLSERRTAERTLSTGCYRPSRRSHTVKRARHRRPGHMQRGPSSATVQPQCGPERRA